MKEAVRITLKVQIAKYTDIGNRSVNEDYMLTRSVDNCCFFAVADGLGGHGLGDVASRIACETAWESFYHMIPDAIDHEKLYFDCQNALLEEQEKLGASGQMRTTLNLLFLHGHTAHWSHIGDSRSYYFKNQQIVRHTFDHSVPQMLAAAGRIREEDIRFHEDRNRLLRVLGVKDMRPAFDIEEPIPLAGEQQFLICSDGFWENITEEQILLCLQEAEEPHLWMDNMIELVCRNSQKKEADNRTAIAVWINT